MVNKKEDYQINDNPLILFMEMNGD